MSFVLMTSLNANLIHFKRSQSKTDRTRSRKNEAISSNKSSPIKNKEMVEQANLMVSSRFDLELIAKIKLDLERMKQLHLSRHLLNKVENLQLEMKHTNLMVPFHLDLRQMVEIELQTKK